MRSHTSEKRQLKENIILLRSNGLTYKEIAEELNCSKGTISYHLNPETKRKSKETLEKQREGLGYRFRRFMYNEARYKGEKNPPSSDLRGRFKNFMYGDPRRSYKMEIDKDDLNYKILDCWKKFWPDYTHKMQSVQAVNQHTDELDFYSNGEPIYYPYIRCFATDDIVNALTETQNDHLDGDHSNNRLSNLTLIRSKCNETKSNLTYEKFIELTKKMMETHEKYKV